MKSSENIANQISEWYSNGYFNSPDLIKHLQNNRIDNCEPSADSHTGFDLSYDKSMAVFYFNDNSVLIVSSCGITAK